MWMPSSLASATGGIFAARSISAVLRPERPWMPRRASRILSWAVEIG